LNERSSHEAETLSMDQGRLGHGGPNVEIVQDHRLADESAISRQPDE
jgi:hypothetical protein